MSLAAHDVALVRAGNPGPFTLTGTNTWLVGRDPCWVVDPGPALEEHRAAVLAEAAGRGGVGGIVVTHDHHDHVDGLPALREATGAPVAAARGAVDVVLGDGDAIGPFTVLATPGHAPDHLAFLGAGVAFTGDAVLGEGSVFVLGQLGAYLAALGRLKEAAPALLCCGHGPVVEDPAAHVDGYVAHRLARERALVAALDDGLRRVDELLDRVWADAPDALRLAAAVTLDAHLGKLDDEGRLPEGVERVAIPKDLRAP
ncbi:MAG TPA: MBL fold metallo-hydrolase [Solirubrobacteraceae bacterium]|nr:MBL fold metallo-hydrolase [Solirubrobacteraceae bacterium]